MRWFVLILILVGIGARIVSGQDTPTPTPTLTPTTTPTPTLEPWVYATIAPEDDPEGEGIQTRFDYVVSVGDVMVSVLILALLLSMWSMFVYIVIRDGD